MTDPIQPLIDAGEAMADDPTTNPKLAVAWDRCLVHFLDNRPMTTKEAGRKGGISTSPRKANASRLNGKKNKGKRKK
jgi:hypothetical protein